MGDRDNEQSPHEPPAAEAAAVSTGPRAADRQQLERELAAARQQLLQASALLNSLRAGLEGSDVVVWDWDRERGELTVLGAHHPGPSGLTVPAPWDCPAEDERVHPDDRSLLHRAVEAHLRGLTPQFEAEYRRREGEGWRWCRDQGRAIQWDSSGRAVRLVGTRTDISQRKMIEQASWESELRFRDAFENAALGLAVADVQDDGLIVETNLALQRMLGLEPGQLIGRRLIELIHAEDVAGFERFWNELRAGQRLSFRTEQRYLCAQGQTLWARLSVSLVLDARRRPLYVMAVMEDVTDRKRAERSTHAEQNLLRRLLELNDTERRLLAYEIHDGLVQDLVGAKMILEAAMHRGGAAAEDAMRQPLHFLSRAINEGRRLISDLRPMVIEELGLIEALRYLVEEQRAEGGMRIDFEHRATFDRLPDLLEGTLYRIVQESLNNVRRHARTDRVRLSLIQVGGDLELVIEDSGQGFDPAAVAADRFGLRGIRERARLFGGRASIESRPGAGTRIQVVMPTELRPDLLDLEPPALD
ncbi:MAG: PAS domain S-box protein [Pirellulaceae bacterium]|nr:PAS domain S-box protein [Pirellulaceae bacterium]